MKYKYNFRGAMKNTMQKLHPKRQYLNRNINIHWEINLLANLDLACFHLIKSPNILDEIIKYKLPYQKHFNIIIEYIVQIFVH